MKHAVLQGSQRAAAMAVRHLCTCVLLTSVLPAVHAVTTSISVTTKLAGTTLSVMGINSGHAFSGSNWEMWLDRLGVRKSFARPRSPLQNGDMRRAQPTRARGGSGVTFTPSALTA